MLYCITHHIEVKLPWVLVCYGIRISVDNRVNPNPPPITHYDTR